MDTNYKQPEHSHGDKHMSKKSIDDALDYAGVAINQADDNKVNDTLVRERTKEMNNNPRNNDL